VWRCAEGGGGSSFNIESDLSSNHPQLSGFSPSDLRAIIVHSDKRKRSAVVVWKVRTSVVILQAPSLACLWERQDHNSIDAAVRWPCDKAPTLPATSSSQPARGCCNKRSTLSKPAEIACSIRNPPRLKEALRGLARGVPIYRRRCSSAPRARRSVLKARHHLRSLHRAKTGWRFAPCQRPPASESLRLQSELPSR
jgi:hypothetical protein